MSEADSAAMPRPARRFRLASPATALAAAAVVLALMIVEALEPAHVWVWTSPLR